MKTKLSFLITLSIILICVSGCNNRSEGIIIDTPTIEPSSSPSPQPTSTNSPTITEEIQNTSTPKPPSPTSTPDPWSQRWDIQCYAKGCLMFLDIPHVHPNNEDEVEFITISVAVNNDKSIQFIDFITPGIASQDFGLVVAFADSSLDENDYSILPKEDSLRILPIDCGERDCRSIVYEGIILEDSDQARLNLIDNFMEHSFIWFMYFTDQGEDMSAMATLSGFQVQFPELLESMYSE